MSPATGMSAVNAFPFCLRRSSTISARLLPAYQLRNSPLPTPAVHSTSGARRSSTRTNPASLSGRTCLITGGTSGIGHAIAARFLQEGAGRVILVGRSYARLVDAASRLDGSRGAGDGGASDVATRAPEEDQQDTGGNGEAARTEEKQSGSLVRSSEKISLLVGDVGDLSAGGWMKELEREMESVDILVNAAGQSISSILPKSDLPEISRILSTNLEGAILTSRALLRASIRARARTRNRPSTAAQDSGNPLSKCIINISSLLAEQGGTGVVPYAASKAGLLGLTRSLAVEAASTLRDVAVRSNAIVPGYIDTPMISDFSEGETARLKELIPLRRFGDPSEVADAAVFLARNEYANNCVLNLDGGLSAV
ncbi:carrier protein reductase [Aspergillus sp. HF37]|nr:carrier protein reductase [Aspergillus sp. HF37]